MWWSVVDTSYLTELFKVPGRFEDASAAAVRGKFAEAIEAAARLYVPVPVIFELANHIANVTDGGSRRTLARHLASAIATSVENDTPWRIFPNRDDAILRSLGHTLELCNAFAAEFAIQQIGLTDTSVIVAARELHPRAVNRFPVCPVHIWTRDHAIKAHEPSAEINPFV
jgi:hypothetical protein